MCFRVGRDEKCCLDAAKGRIIRDGSAFFKVNINDLNSLMVGVSDEVPLCRIRLKRMR